MGASKQYRWGKTSGGVLLFMIGGCFLLASGCATPQEFFSRKWEKYRDSRDDDEKKFAEAIPPKTPAKDFPKSQKKRSWFRWGSESPKVATEKAQPDDKKADDKKADTGSTDKLARQLAETNKSGKPNTAAKPTDPRMAQAKNTLNSVQPRTNTSAKPAAQSKPLLDVKDPFREELDDKPAASELALNGAKPNPRAKAPAAGLDAPWATHNPAGADDAKVAAKGAAAGAANSVDMSGLTEEQITNLNKLNAIMHLSDEDLAAAVAEARKENAGREAIEKPALADIEPKTEGASAADSLDENPFAKFDRERDLAKSETISAEKTVIEEPKGAPIEDENRVEADTLMFRARMALKRNRRDDALRLAEAAEELERTAQIQYSRNEERPSDLVRRLKGVSAADEGITTAAAAVTAGERRHTENPFAAEESVASQTGMSRGSLELARRNVVAEMPPERSSISSSDFLSGNWRDVTSEPADTRIQMANAEQPAREPWRPETNPIVASNGAMSVPATASQDSNASERASAEGSPAWVRDSATDVAPAPPPPSAVCEMPDSEDEDENEPVAREMFDIPEDKPQSAEYPLPLVLGFGLGMAGICGFGFWRRMQSHRFAPRS